MASLAQEDFETGTVDAHRTQVSVAYRGIITIEPRKRGGKPVIRGLRITVDDVLSYLAAGMTVEHARSDWLAGQPEDPSGYPLLDIGDAVSYVEPPDDHFNVVALADDGPRVVFDDGPYDPRRELGDKLWLTDMEAGTTRVIARTLIVAPSACPTSTVTMWSGLSTRTTV